MAFNLPPLKHQPINEKTSFQRDCGTFGVPELMKSGISSMNTDFVHPLAQSERNFYKNREQLNMTMLRNTQGLHAPMRLQMEFMAAKKIGRLPFLESSNVMLDSLTGRDIEVMPEDIYNTSEFKEAIGQPHAVVEKSLGIL